MTISKQNWRIIYENLSEGTVPGAFSLLLTSLELVSSLVSL
jgi:hypothetical protein